MKQVLILLILSTFLASCSKKAEPYPPVEDYSKSPPRQLTYGSSNYVFSNQLTITPMYPTYYGAVATNFTINPPLPNGLHLSSKSGRIAGTPEGISPVQNYIVTASNANGVTAIQISIGVIAQAPTSLRYPGVGENGEYEAISGLSVVSLIPEYNDGIRGGGTIVSYAINPTTLPQGLSFSTSSGYIEGTPVGGAFPPTVYTITGTNSGGTISTQITLSVTGSISNIASGGQHNCVKKGTAIYCWGDNLYGQLGNNSTTASALEVQVQGLPNKNIRDLQAGSNYSCAVDDGYEIYCWGRNNTSQLGPYLSAGNKLVASLWNIDDPYEFITLSKSDYFDADAKFSTCGVDLFNKNLFCAGEYDNFNLSANNYQVRDPLGNNVSNVSSLASGGNFSCYSKVNEGVFCLGDNSFGQLGDNGASGAFSINASPVFNSHPIVYQIATGANFACYLNNLNKVYCWGSNNLKQLGSPGYTDATSIVPVETDGITEEMGFITTVAAGRDFACSLISTKVYCWGNNNKGQLGRGVTGGSSASAAVVVLEDNSELSGVSELSVGEQHACAVSNNKVYCWGDNSSRQVQNSIVPNFSKAQVTIAN